MAREGRGEWRVGEERKGKGRGEKGGGGGKGKGEGKGCVMVVGGWTPLAALSRC